jgi:hypothetical protein
MEKIIATPQTNKKTETTVIIEKQAIKK